MGIKAGTGSDFWKYTGTMLTNNNIMNVKTQGTNCRTPQAVNCSDDSGAFGTFRYNLVLSTCGAGCAESNGLIARGTDTSFRPTNGTVFEFNTVYLTGPESQAIVCHASCPSSTVIRGNILVGVKNSLWINGYGWTERQNVLNGPTNFTRNSTSTTAPARPLPIRGLRVRLPQLLTPG